MLNRFLSVHNKPLLILTRVGDAVSIGDTKSGGTSIDKVSFMTLTRYKIKPPAFNISSVKKQKHAKKMEFVTKVHFRKMKSLESHLILSSC